MASLPPSAFRVVLGQSTLGRIPFHRPSRTRPNGLPLFVTFTDEREPHTIFEVDPFDMGKHFPGVRLMGFDIEFTDAPITKVLSQRLPWLDRSVKEKNFATDPPGQHRPVKDRPLDYKISKSRFFAIGSQ